MQIKNSKALEWIEQIQALCEPDRVYFCDGSNEQYNELASLLVEQGVFIPLNPKKKPHSFLARSHPKDVARVESKTFICTEDAIDAGPTNHWQEPHLLQEQQKKLYQGCMKGKTMYVIVFLMGPYDCSASRVGIEITDSAYVVCNMHLMTRIGTKVLPYLETQDFVKCLHSVGIPESGMYENPRWPCDPSRVVIAHYPEQRTVWSYGSGYGGNALLGKKCFALRLASFLGNKEGWLAEHMLIIGVTSPQGIKKYFVAAFPSACGKTNMAMLTPSVPGWKVECVGDDIAWLFWKDNKLHAINPEAGFFGVAPGTSSKTNPHALETLKHDAIFTNVALTQDHDVWWEGLSDPPENLIDWHGNPWTSTSKTTAAHPNSRFTVAAKQCPVIDPAFESQEGVVVDAIIFGGRRGESLPLIYESLDWDHGVLVGASISSEQTAAAEGTVGALRHDPFAMLPFCGYHMGDYFQHWFDQKKEGRTMPKIFGVNWFRKKEGSFLWPGFGENIRVLEWIFNRTEDKAVAEETPIGYVPTTLNLEGLDLSPSTLQHLLEVDPKFWTQELHLLEEYFEQFKTKLPKKLSNQLEKIKQRLSNV